MFRGYDQITNRKTFGERTGLDADWRGEFRMGMAAEVDRRIANPPHFFQNLLAVPNDYDVRPDKKRFHLDRTLRGRNPCTS